MLLFERLESAVGEMDAAKLDELSASLDGDVLGVLCPVGDDLASGTVANVDVVQDGAEGSEDDVGVTANIGTDVVDEVGEGDATKFGETADPEF